MKGLLKEGLSIDENTMLAIGTEVEILEECGILNNSFFICKTGEWIGSVPAFKVKITDYQSKIDWEQRRWELIKELYVKCNFQENPQKQADISIYYADELIKRLKGDSNEN